MRYMAAASALVILLSLGLDVNAAAGVGTEAASVDDADAARVPLAEAVNGDPDNFGVPYLDEDGAFVVQYVGENLGRPAVERQLSPDLQLRWEKVDYSRSELRRIGADVRDLNLDGVVAISMGSQRNRVIVKVGPSGSVEKVAEAVSAFGKAVQVESTTDMPLAALTCTNRYDCQRWRGGINIYLSGTTSRCTWGFQASDAGYLIMVTAGHCQVVGGKFTHDGVTIGSSGVSKNGINPATFEGVDVERTRVTGTYYPTTQNTLYRDDANKSWTMTSVRPNVQFYLGMDVAKSGTSTNYSVGDLDDIEVSYRLLVENPGELVYYPNCSISNPSACPLVTGSHSNTYVGGGDSGGPVYVAAPSHVFLGFVSAGGGSDLPYGSGYSMYFSRAEDALGALDLDFWCVTSGCP